MQVDGQQAVDTGNAEHVGDDFSGDRNSGGP